MNFDHLMNKITVIKAKIKITNEKEILEKKNYTLFTIGLAIKRNRECRNEFLCSLF